MISRGEAISFMAVSLVIANVILFKGFSQRGEQTEEDHSYRYSRTFGKFFLFMIPVFAGMAFIIYSSDSKPPEGSGLAVFSVFAVAMVGFPILGYAYVTRYRVSVDARGITVVSLFRNRFVAFSDIAAIATMRGKGVDYWLFSPNDRCIAKIGGSVQNFESLQDDVELGTRFKKVMLYDFETFQGWREKANDSDDEWRKSEGPPLIRDRNRRLNIEMVIGGVLVAALIAYIRFYLR
jgi:Bacterial PH domain